MSFLEKWSFAPPKVYGGSLQSASSSAGEMSVEKTDQFMNLTNTHAKLMLNLNCISMDLKRIFCHFGPFTLTP